MGGMRAKLWDLEDAEQEGATHQRAPRSKHGPPLLLFHTLAIGAGAGEHKHSKTHHRLISFDNTRMSVA